MGKKLKCNACGKEVNCTIGGWCDTCYPVELAKEKELFVARKEQCSDCGKYYLHDAYGRAHLCNECIEDALKADRQAEIMIERQERALDEYMRSLE